MKARLIGLSLAAVLIVDNAAQTPPTAARATSTAVSAPPTATTEATNPNTYLNERVKDELGIKSSHAGMTTSGDLFGGEMQYRTRLSGVVATPRGRNSIVFTSDPLPQKEMEELSEDLSVFSVLVQRGLERVAGDSVTEYRLGVPMTMRDGHSVETSYLQDYGVLVKVHVGFPLIGQADGSSDPKQREDSEWERARRSLLGPTAGSSSAPGSVVKYDAKVVEDLRAQMTEALRNASNLRHIDKSQRISIVISGAPTFRPDQARRIDDRPTVLSLQVEKSIADQAATNNAGSDWFTGNIRSSKYFAPFGVQPASGAGGMMGGFGGGGYGASFSPAGGGGVGR